MVDGDICLTPGAVVVDEENKTCFWLENASNADYGGKCWSVANSGVKCGSVADTSACTDGKLKQTIITGRCGD
jgi:hypothetical protein